MPLNVIRAPMTGHLSPHHGDEANGSRYQPKLTTASAGCFCPTPSPLSNHCWDCPATSWTLHSMLSKPIPSLSRSGRKEESTGNPSFPFTILFLPDLRTGMGGKITFFFFHCLSWISVTGISLISSQNSSSLTPSSWRCATQRGHMALFLHLWPSCL